MIVALHPGKWCSGLGFLNSDPYLSAGLASKQKERKKMKNTPVASKDEPTQFILCTSLLEDKAWSYSLEFG